MKAFEKVAALAFLLALAPMVNVSAEELSQYNGKQLFGRFCAACHGENAEGNGPVAPFFKLSPPDLTRLAKRRGGEFPTEEIRSIIDGRAYKGPHGTRQMPIWGMELDNAATGRSDNPKPAETLIDRLVEYLRSIQKV